MVNLPTHCSGEAPATNIDLANLLPEKFYKAEGRVCRGARDCRGWGVLGVGGVEIWGEGVTGLSGQSIVIVMSASNSPPFSIISTACLYLISMWLN